MYERQHPATEDLEIPLELSHRTDPAFDLAATRIPEALRIRRESGAAPGIQGPTPLAGSGSDQLEQARMIEQTIRGHTERERRELCRVEIDGDHPGRVVREHRER